MGKKSRTSSGEKSTSHMLVIRLSAMGDVAMTVPVISALTNQYPQLKITVLTREFFRPMFSQIPEINVYAADVKGKHKGVAGLWKLYKELKALHMDAVADLHHVLRSNILKKFFLLDAVPFVQINKGRAEKKSLTALKNKIFKPLKTTHERYADVFSRLGFPLDIGHTVVLPKQALSDKALGIVGSDAKRWIGIAPFAAFEGKTYPTDLMERVIRALNNTEKYKILFFGGTNEKAMLDYWEKQFGHCVNIAGKLSFQEELALISNLDLMLCMDSGNAHLSAMYGVPTITLWGVTHPYAGFYPFKQDADNALLSDRETYPLIPTSVYGNRMPKGYEKVMETISPHEVFLKINKILNEK
ncbi:MAG: glycosyltransferase family 9 protein [Saonia sp.]